MKEKLQALGQCIGFKEPSKVLEKRQQNKLRQPQLSVMKASSAGDSSEG